jgi:hypothetical protein
VPTVTAVVVRAVVVGVVVGVVVRVVVGVVAVVAGDVIAKLASICVKTLVVAGDVNFTVVPDDDVVTRGVVVPRVVVVEVVIVVVGRVKLVACIVVVVVGNVVRPVVVGHPQTNINAPAPHPPTAALVQLTPPCAPDESQQPIFVAPKCAHASGFGAVQASAATISKPSVLAALTTRMIRTNKLSAPRSRRGTIYRISCIRNVVAITSHVLARLWHVRIGAAVGEVV